MTVADVGGAEVSEPPTLTMKTAAVSWVQDSVATSWVVSSRCLSMLGRCPCALFITETWDRVTEHIKIPAGLQIGEVSQQKKVNLCEKLCRSTF